MTAWVDVETLTAAAAQNLSTSEYSRAFIHAVLGIEEQVLYQRQLAAPGQNRITTDERGEEQRLIGDKAFFPARSTTTWHVPVHVRKLGVPHPQMPVSLRFAWRAPRRVQR
jgi:hypothetical protein